MNTLKDNGQTEGQRNNWEVISTSQTAYVGDAKYVNCKNTVTVTEICLVYNVQLQVQQEHV